MGGGGRGGAKHKAPVVKGTKSKKEEQAKLEEPTGANVIDMESKFSCKNKQKQQTTARKNFWSRGRLS